MSEESLIPCLDAEHSLATAKSTLVTANNADRLALDWQAQNASLMDLRRLVKYHSKEVQMQVGGIYRLLAPSVSALRSNTSKMCMTLIQEMARKYGPGMDAGLEHLIPVLAQRSGEVSSAGRETFLATLADSTILELITHLTPIKITVALLGLAQHKNSQVRAKIAGHLDCIIQSDAGKTFTGNAGVMERLLRAGVSFSEEGSQEARVFGKRILWRCHQLVSTNKGAFQGLLNALEGDAKRKKVLEAVQGRLLPPPEKKMGTTTRSDLPLGSPLSHPSSPASKFLPASPLRRFNGPLQSAES